MSSLRLQSYINEHHIGAEILKLTEPTPTVLEAARVLGVDQEQVIKSLVFETPNGPLLVVGAGTSRIDQAKLASHLGVSRRKIRFAKPDRAYEISGYVVGSMPPFGHLQKLTTVIDSKVLEFQELFAGGGDTDAMMRVGLMELLEMTRASVADLR